MAGISQRGAYELLASGAFSDFTITCGDRDFKVHRSIICADSHFFKSSMSNFSESEQKKVTLQEEDTETVARVIHFLYLGDYHTEEICAQAAHDTLAHTLRYTDIPHALQSFELEFAQTVEASIDYTKPQPEVLIHADVYRCADKLGIEPLKIISAMALLKHLQDKQQDPKIFEQALLKVYEGTAQGDTILRLTLTKLCIANYEEVNKRPGLVTAIETHELLSWQIGKALLAETRREKREQAWRAVDTLLNHNKPGSTCNYTKCNQFQSSKGYEGNVWVSFEPRCLEDWEGVLQVRCSRCHGTVYVSGKERTQGYL